MLKKEKYIVALVFIFLVFTLSSLKIVKWNENHGDTAFLYQLTENIASRGIPVSSISKSISHFLFEEKIVTMPPSELLRSPLKPPKELELNFFHLHTYLILYLIAPMNWLIPIDILLPVLTVLSFVGMLLLIYIMLRKNKVPIISSIIFCLLIIAHPAWSQSIQGQIYVDRFFLSLGLLFIYMFTSNNPQKTYIILTGILVLIMHERTGVVAGIFAVGYTLLFWYQNTQLRLFRLNTGLALIFISTLIRKIFIDYPAYNGFLPNSFAELIARLSDPVFVDKLAIFLLFNIIILGAIAVFSWRAFALAFITMLPSIVGNIGGAEKIGWSTHYHTHYFPFLVWAAAIGFIKLSKITNNSLKPKLIFNSMAVFLLIFMIGLNPYEYNQINFSFKNLYYNALAKSAKDIPLYFGSYGQELSKVKEQIQAAVPENSIVSMPEGTMTILYKNRTVHFYPVGIDTADYAILHILGTNDSGYIYGGAVTYLGKESLDALNRGLIERMKKVGYDFENPTILSLVNMAVIKRISKR